MTTQTISHELNWSELLRSAVKDTGIISKAYSVFHNYSIGNQILATMQCIAQGIPVAPINTYNGWKKLNRQVKKGSKAIQLCMPVICKYKETDEKTGEEIEHAFKRFTYKKNWFVMSQTEGKTQPRAKLPNFNIEKALSELDIEEVAFEHISGNTQGYARSRSIAVSPIAEFPHKTRFHEMAHVVLGHTAENNMEDAPDTPRDIKEVEAESVAYILCNILELSGTVQSRGYIQHWLQTDAIPEKSAQKIFGAADKILKAGV